MGDGLFIVLEGIDGAGKSRQFMNVSGPGFASLAKRNDVPPERVVAVHDEIDIPFAALKLKIGGGEGGHNGLRDMSKALSTKDYYRVRVGVGRPPGRMDAASYVLKPFTATEGKELPFLLDEQLVGRVDLKADRAAGVLRVQSLHWEGATDVARALPALQDELTSMAGWLGLGRVDLPVG